MNQDINQMPATPADNDGRAPKGTLLSLLRKFQTSLILSFLALLFVVVMFWQTIIIFNHPGQQGVYWSRFFGGTSQRILLEGAHLKLPWDEIAIYDMRLAAIHETTMLLSKDGMEMEVSWSVRFHPNSAQLPHLHQEIGPDYANKVIVPGVISSLRQVLGNYTAEEIYARDEQSLLDELERLIFTHFDTYPVYIKNVLILRLQLPKEMAEGIVKKLLYKQEMLAYDFRLHAAKLEKQRMRIEAEALHQFEQISGVPILKWRGIAATVELAKSPNSKIIVIGTNSQSLPLLLNTDK